LNDNSILGYGEGWPSFCSTSIASLINEMRGETQQQILLQEDLWVYVFDSVGL
jgi:hypothetical protein